MNRYLSVVGIVLAMSFFAMSVPSFAGELFASGDTNFLDALNGTTNSASVDAGNRQFILNVLASGDVVVLLDTTAPFLEDTAEAARDYLNTVSGVTATTFSGTVTPAVLTSVDLLIAVAPDDAFTASEVAAMTMLLQTGGNVLLTGENSHRDFTTVNTSVNLALMGLGSSMSLTAARIDDGFNPASILFDPFTTGVTTFTYASTSQIDGGTPLFEATQSRTFLARQTIVPEPASWALAAVVCIAIANVRVRTSRRAHGLWGLHRGKTIE